MVEKGYNGLTETSSSSNEIVKDVTKVLKKISVGTLGTEDETLSEISKVGENANEVESSEGGSKFKVCTATSLEKPSVWTKIKNALFTEIKVELTPRQQKIENEINEFLHKEITWQSVKAFWTQEVKITL